MFKPRTGPECFSSVDKEYVHCEMSSMYSMWYSWCLSYREPGFTVLQTAWYCGSGLSQQLGSGRRRTGNWTFFFTLLNSKDNLWHHSRLSLWHHSLLSVRLLTVGFRKPTGCLSFCVAMVTWIISLLSKTAVWDLIISQVWMRVLTGNSMPQQHGRFSLSLFAVFGTSNRNGPRDGWHVA